MNSASHKCLLTVRNFRGMQRRTKALRYDKSLSLRLDLPPLPKDCQGFKQIVSRIQQSQRINDSNSITSFRTS